MEYEQLIPWVNPGEGAFRVISGDYVTTEDGTGIGSGRYSSMGARYNFGFTWQSSDDTLTINWDGNESGLEGVLWSKYVGLKNENDMNGKPLISITNE